MCYIQLNGENSSLHIAGLYCTAGQGGELAHFGGGPGELSSRAAVSLEEKAVLIFSA